VSPQDTDNQRALKRVIVVLGMHRSGTSVITRSLQVLGVTLGDRLMLPHAINPKGFWEDVDVNELNIQMLKALGSDWHYLAPIEQDDVDALREKGFIASATDLLRRKVGDSLVFGFKDPRVAKLLPFWKAAISHCGLKAGYVLTLRHPLSVVDSLRRGMGFDAEKSYILWLGHVITSVAGTVDENRVIVDYDRMMQSPARELGRIANQLGLAIDPDALHDYKSNFLDPALRHSAYSLGDLSQDSACPPLVRDVYSILLDVAADKQSINDAALNAVAVRWIEEFARSKSLLMLVDRLYARNLSPEQFTAKLNNVIAERDGHIARLAQTVAERDAQIGELSQLILERDRLIQAFIDSTSWRLTKPLRALRRLMS
jgi:hypothetical protein